MRDNSRPFFSCAFLLYAIATLSPTAAGFRYCISVAPTTTVCYAQGRIYAKRNKIGLILTLKKPGAVIMTAVGGNTTNIILPNTTNIRCSRGKDFKFMKDFVLSLVKPHLQRRASNQRLTRELFEPARYVTKKPPGQFRVNRALSLFYRKEKMHSPALKNGRKAKRKLGWFTLAFTFRLNACSEKDDKTDNACE
ncbi:hypothetical protein EVAR_9898_1 [Eumeta japonica]|uniref:Uncharacterized protein n=1 Tax=Eumeta variegata TaxID=151549 RepID=A0A4C1TQF2_EUMVA|nr:hypothetical protein EVAR_9898_1 [Eumeta japonica]